jgi:hypothetical protein
MDAKRAILWVSAITLIGVGVLLRREAASPALSSVGDAVPAVGKQRVTLSQRLFSPARNEARLLVPLEDDLESVRQLAESDPAAAAIWAARLSAGPARVDGIKAVAIAWANRDLSGAVEWGRQLPNESERQMVLTCIGFEAARTDPLTALALAAELNANSERDELIRHAAGEWAVTAAYAAVEWARQIEGGPLRNRTLAAITVAWAERDPRAAATLATEELEPGRLREDAVVSVVQRWVQQEPTAAAAWISTFEEGELQAAAVQNLVRLWADQNPGEAGEWLKGLLPGSMRNLAIAAYEEQIAPAF